MHTQAGPLHPSQGMLELLRLCRARGVKFGEASLDLSAVHAIELELGATLPDDVLIVMALHDPDLTCAAGVSIDRILDCAEDWGGALPSSHVAIGVFYPEPFAARDEGAHGAALQVIGIRRDGLSSSPQVLVTEAIRRRRGDDSSELERADSGTTLADLARDNLTAWLRDRDGWLDVQRRQAQLPLLDETFRPALTGVLAAEPRAVVRVVLHPKFGRGRVVEERSDGGESKLVVDFETAGQKTLLARFVTPAPP